VSRTQGRRYILALIAATGLLSAVAVHRAPADDVKAAFERREDTMKHMGRPLYLGIGRVVKGTAAYGPDTVSAAETVATLAATLDRSLFPPGSNVADSKMRPEIFAAGEHVDQLIAAVQAAVAKLVPAVKSGDNVAITAAYTAAADACNACHKEFRKEE
jgi:cytochrome c556